MFFEVHAWIFVQYVFSGTFINFCLMMFTKIMMKDLARILIHVRKLFNCSVSFKMLLSMCLVIVVKEL